MEPAERSALHVAALRKLLRGAAPQAPGMQPLGPPNAGIQLATYWDCPGPGLSTLITIGLSTLPYSSWRALPLGMELTLTTGADQDEFVELLGGLVSEEINRPSGDRRRIVEYNGVWAAGYPPHLVFTQVVSATPQLMVQKKIGDSYVKWLTAVPIDDRELRRYDRNIPAFLDELTPETVTVYPRPTPDGPG